MNFDSKTIEHVADLLASSDLYYDTKRILIWKKESFRLLSDILLNSNMKPFKFAKYSKLIYKYYTDVLNFPTDRPDICKELIWKISVKSGIQDDEAIAQALKSAEEFVKTRHINPPIIRITPSPKKFTISISGIYIEMPTHIASELLNRGWHHFCNLCLRYNVLGPSDGLFLSIDKDIYSYLEYTSKLNVVEGYASPFNYNLPKYCSIYKDDSVYNSLGPYKNYIQNLTYPVRFILNPPYTNRTMEECINLLLEYMDKYNGEFILMLPVMIDYDPIIRLLKYPNTYHKLTKGNTYTIHDHSKNKRILAPMDLIFVANIGGDIEKSKECVEEITAYLSLLAERIISKQNKTDECKPWHKTNSLPETPIIARNCSK